MDVSVIIPVHNEEEILEKNLSRIYSSLEKSSMVGKFEILLCENGSEDSTPVIVKNLSKKNSKIKSIILKKRGIGLAVKSGILKARHDIVVFYAIDIPYGADYVVHGLRALKSHNADILIGSKTHRKSSTARPRDRAILSKIYHFLVILFFNVKEDTMGSLMFRKSKIRVFLSMLNASNPSLNTELIVYSKLYNLRIVEIPVFVRDRKDSRLKSFRDGISMFFSLLNCFFRYIVYKHTTYKMHYKKISRNAENR